MTIYSYKQVHEEYYRENCASIEDAIEAARLDYGVEGVVSIGELKTISADDIADFFWIGDTIAEHLYDNYGEPAADNFDITDEQEKELKEFIKQWADKHNLFGVGGCGTVQSIKNYNLETGEVLAS